MADKSLWSEAELLQAAREGVDGAFVELCCRSLPALRSFLQSRVRRAGLPSDLADDFAHETILRVAKWPNENQAKVAMDPRPKTGWLITIANNVMRDWLRKNRLVQMSDEGLSSLVDENGDDHESHLVLDKFKDLAPEDQEVLWAVLVDERSPKELANEMGIGEWATRKRYQRALDRLRQKLNNVEIGHGEEETT